MTVTQRKKIVVILAAAGALLLLLAGLFRVALRREREREAIPSAVPVSAEPSPVPTATPYVPSPPVLTIAGGDTLYIPAAPAPYEDPGCTALDALDGDISQRIEMTVDVFPYRAGEGSVTYTVTDSEGYTVTAVRRVIVTAVGTPETEIPAGRVIYLTFDDGPSANTDRLLDVLDAYGVKATWFVTAVHGEYLDRLTSIAERGHTLAIHSATHDYNAIYQSEEAFFEDLLSMQDTIFAYTGQRPALLRFPGGGSNTVSAYNPGIMTRLTECLSDMGYVYFDWNVTAADTAPDASAAAVFANVTEGAAQRDWSVVLQHDTCAFSVDTVEAILQWGLQNGYTFLPLTETSPTARHPLNN